MNCRDVEAFLPLYSGGELSRWRRFRMTRHLDRCDRCRASLAELDSTRSVVSEALKAAWSPGNGDSVWEDVRSKLPQVESSRVGEKTPGAYRPGRVRRWKFAFVPAAALAVALILVVVTTKDNGVAPTGGRVAPAATGPNPPPVVERIDGPGVKILDFETDNPGVTIAWVFRPASDGQDGQDDR